MAQSSRISCSLENSVILFTATLLVRCRMGLVTASRYCTDMDRTTFVGQGREQRHAGSSKHLRQDTEPVLFLLEGILCAGCSQTLGIRVRELNENTASRAPLPAEICLVLVIASDL